MESRSDMFVIVLGHTAGRLIDVISYRDHVIILEAFPVDSAHCHVLRVRNELLLLCT